MKNHFVDLYDVLPPNHYLFILFIYFICRHRRWFCLSSRDSAAMVM